MIGRRDGADELTVYADPSRVAAQVAISPAQG